MPSLTRVEATARAAAISVESYQVDLDVTGDERFRSQVTIRFRATPGSRTFVECRPQTLCSVRINDTDLDPAMLVDNRLPLTGLAERNTLTIEAEMGYTNTGEGMHRFVDPADGETYLYAMSFLDQAQRIFAAFDQPDLKAPVTLTVTAPEHWTVAANGVLAASPRPGRWEFAPTVPLATYLVSLIAGPWYVHRDEHDGIPLGVWCRRSLAAHLDSEIDEILTITKQCLDRYHQLFAQRYPFGKYDQAFVPEFNAGAMENPGLVTIRDDYVFRSAVTDSEREWRASTIAHEMAHMWFGDLVTMRWWDDLWLNESFAEYMATRVTAEATRFDRGWTTFAMRRKIWGYAADQRPSTHPVAPAEVTDAAQGLLNFDGISYAKGAAVLRQLVAWLGDEDFLAGLNAYFAEHRFGNATLEDLLASLTTASGRDLTGWARCWLRTAQVNTLRTKVSVDVDGRYTEVALVQSAPDSHPVLRPHRVGLARYAADGTVEHRLVDLEPSVDGGRTVLADLAGQRAAQLLLPNAGDLTFAKIRLDPASADAVPLLLPRLADSLARALLWGAELDAVTDGERPVTELVQLIATALLAETEVVIVEDVVAISRSLIDRYLAPSAREAALALVSVATGQLLATAPPGGSLQLAAARGWVAATDDVDRLAGWPARSGRRVSRSTRSCGGRCWGGWWRWVGPARRRSPPRRRPTRAPPVASGPPVVVRPCPTRRPNRPPGRSSWRIPKAQTAWSRPPQRASGSRSRRR